MNRQPPSASPRPHREGEPRTIPREEDAPRALIALMIGLMLLAVAGSFLWVQGRETAGTVIGRPATLGQRGPILSVREIVEERAKGNLLGRDVAIWGARVVEVTGDWLFWVGADRGRAVPVVLLGEQTARQYELQTEVRAGDTLAVFGSVRAVRDVSTLDGPSAMTRADRQELAGAQVYVSALRVEPLGRRETGEP